MDLIAITMGDPAGVGPEVALQAITRECDIKEGYIIFGSVEVLNYYIKLLNIDMEMNILEDETGFNPDKINIINVVELKMEDFTFGQVSPICGDAAYKYIERAIDYALAGKVSAVVTGPINKEALNLAGHHYDGHTEIFAKLTDTKIYSMMLSGGPLKVAHVSTHTSLRNACDRVKKERVFDVINLANKTLKQMGYEEPIIAVAGLNPHAGESGLFGREEIEEISPAIEQAIAEGIKVQGPVPPDTVFLNAVKGQYDIVIAMYHDQGHIPLKLLGFDIGVNMTIGLPIIRTSVDHGTAFGKAGKGIANYKSMVEAMKMAELFLGK